MVKLFCAGSFALLAVTVAVGQVMPSTEELIRQLGSSDFRVRDKATKALMARPDTEPALRLAAKGKDAEVAARAAHLLKEIEIRRSPFAELDKALADGRVDRVIELISEWPKGSHEDGLWQRAGTFLSDIINANNVRSNDKLTQYVPPKPAAAVVCSTFRESLAIPGLIGSGYLFVRAKEVDYDALRREKKQRPPIDDANSCLVSSGPAHIYGVQHRFNVFARGPVSITGSRFGSAIVLSCDDIVLEAGLSNCLIIAKGSVDCQGYLTNCRIIAGKAVIKGEHCRFTGCNVSVNDSNPLGFIRWSGTPKEKEKATPKSK
jgi:hypothetical protein